MYNNLLRWYLYRLKACYHFLILRGYMHSLQEVCEYLDSYLQCSLFKDYGPNGLQVEGKKNIKKIGTAVTASFETIQKAVALRCDALIVHHGLFWRGDPYQIIGPKYEKIKLLIENEMSLLAYHLPLDAHEQIGNNWKAAIDLNFRDLNPFGKMDEQYIGVKGSFEEISVREFKDRLEKYYGHIAHLALGGKENVANAAILSGGAYKLLPEAKEAGVDCFITGNFDEPAWHWAKELKINFFAMGHSATERVGPKAISNHLANVFKCETVFIDVENPF